MKINNPNEYENIIWIVSSPRSGSTWLFEMLNYHGKYHQSFEPYHCHTKEANLIEPGKYVHVSEK
uniref:Sulfotransferase domain-containing protein n=1 Tax=Candidatus Kentrum sp. FW TaxID=2126338 RepID=A0A450TAF2_9GAMM|nr:MAG: hypothetical protein BECKFW1821A_GA0114235_11535 [Candidatus Kentron sp. FW]